ncbi:hypothetical protein B0T16DRAFT_407805 [Cercophora newfieldiana]|uniref:Rhodopsin domain-containing protein n=1 Tax=Cercophora newfieldiana TaxID=92897 RepID=A0AA39YAT3_9PEZI|nr:hypothetical protein B0T16DRAFT_407805 [Cercophora newfieldiana]
MSTTNSSVPIDPVRLQQSRAHELVGALTTGPSLAFVFVAMRIYTRFVLVRQRFLEDWSILAALATSIGMAVFMGITVINGSGRHVETVSVAEQKDLTKAMIGVIECYLLTHCFLKLSIMLQYCRVATLPWEKNLCFGIIGVLSAGYLSVIIVQMVRCVPFEAQWTPGYPGAVCVNSTAFFFASQALNVFLDVIILLAPLVILRHSSAPLQQRLLFGVALAFGGVASIVSIIRLHTLYPSTVTTDPTWDKVPSGVYGVIEANLGIICACVVTLRPLFHKVQSSISSIKGRASTRTATTRSLPKVSRIRPSLYHITLSSGNNTQVSSDSSEQETRVAVDDRDRGAAAGVSVRDGDQEKWRV